MRISNWYNRSESGLLSFIPDESSPSQVKEHPARRAYRIKETSRILGIGRTKVYSLIAEGKIRSVKIGRCTLIPSEDIDALLNGSLQLQPQARSSEDFGPHRSASRSGLPIELAGDSRTGSRKRPRLLE
jgi:excisionase family DNA binding protein